MKTYSMYPTLCGRGPSLKEKEEYMLIICRVLTMLIPQKGFGGNSSCCRLIELNWTASSRLLVPMRRSASRSVILLWRFIIIKYIKRWPPSSPTPNNSLLVGFEKLRLDPVLWTRMPWRWVTQHEDDRIQVSNCILDLDGLLGLYFEKEVHKS